MPPEEFIAEGSEIAKQGLPDLHPSHLAIMLSQPLAPQPEGLRAVFYQDAWKTRNEFATPFLFCNRKSFRNAPS